MSIAVPRPPIVLVVEDDFLLRMDAVDIVRNAGFEAIEAANADQAIAIIEADPDIHIVFTDVQMPGTMDGLRLARFIRDRWPPIKIVATSGRLRVAEEDLPKGSIFVPKPYSPEKIIRTFRQLTASEGETIAGRR
jgi:two-component system, response regulator PdtaR